MDGQDKGEGELEEEKEDIPLDRESNIDDEEHKQQQEEEQ